MRICSGGRMSAHLPCKNSNIPMPHLQCEHCWLSFSLQKHTGKWKLKESSRCDPVSSMRFCILRYMQVKICYEPILSVGPSPALRLVLFNHRTIFRWKNLGALLFQFHPKILPPRLVIRSADPPLYSGFDSYLRFRSFRLSKHSSLKRCQ